MPADAFARLTGRPPDGVWLAPGRVNLIGEHTDYNDGFVLPFAVEQSVRVAAAARGDGRLRLWSQQEGGPVAIELGDVRPGAVGGWAAYAAGAVALLAGSAGVRRGLDLVVDGSVPRGSGLSSSAALTCAVLVAAADLWHADLDPTALARLAQRAEQDYVGVPVGLMDPLASLLGVEGRALFIDTRAVSVEAVRCDPAAAGLAFLVVDTGVRRRLAEGGYADRRAACERAARLLGVPALRDASPEQVRTAGLDERLIRRALHVVTENARTAAAADLLRAGRLADVGPLLDLSHASLRDDFEVSWPAADATVEAVRAAGALGARMTGGGFGGCVVVLAPADRVGDVTAAVVERAGRDGLPVPGVSTVRPAAGARRVS
ncbi:MAG TPA: galactokinase [Mycobacteriales bacterium]|nr:galactokinase [Mycobacteriales bacterium]